MKKFKNSILQDLPPQVHRSVLPVLVFAQFCGTSLWFASNGIMEELIAAFRLPDSALEHLTAAVQFGFIAGTLVFALFTLADRYSPSRVFFWSAFLGALFNLGMIWDGNTMSTLLVLRFTTGFFLAGIYPVGMKIASDYYDKGLGISMGFLVGALVVGTAFPHVLRSSAEPIPWQWIAGITSLLALIGGVLVAFLPDGPFRKRMPSPDITAFFKVFKNPGFRSASFGYFGHMWELYTFWAFVPLILTTYLEIHPEPDFPISLWAFLIIGIGGPACVISGYLSRRFGEKRVATLCLILSGICCLILPWAFNWENAFWFLAFLLFWGMVVISDSPLFSTLVARNAPPSQKGTALTIVTSIGFAMTILSIEVLGRLQHSTTKPEAYFLLALGPICGVLALLKKSPEKKVL
ncbi:MAG: MFS transporter [Robiginitalea sp.]|uniref:MFS transporter n=1 Tax=Robiginitalea sp. TaxID=1902411 RepID=UPI003C74E84A